MRGRFPCQARVQGCVCVGGGGVGNIFGSRKEMPTCAPSAESQFFPCLETFFSAEGSLGPSFSLHENTAARSATPCRVYLFASGRLHTLRRTRPCRALAPILPQYAKTTIRTYLKKKKKKMKHRHRHSKQRHKYHAGTPRLKKYNYSYRETYAPAPTSYAKTNNLLCVLKPQTQAQQPRIQHHAGLPHGN